MKKTFKVSLKDFEFEETWEHQKLFCPKCGWPDVWSCQGGGTDNYGPKHVCVSCKVSFYIQGPYNDYSEIKPIEEIKQLHCREDFSCNSASVE